ncbi:DUF883 family protein [Pseudaestuariivita atlantica]|uniref:DUF883 domain-containing protein n=1 Tax=Pseudaestuariivita atlantica TaxID=1317121 RepID=A0A0L1JPV5_9RHOB|nr:DUF883 family protein [Pseudaestuariivita atlantica]KNG93800.1 hypothetical protein ATO11_11550 [Pseudaestuariivita atlantica]
MARAQTNGKSAPKEFAELNDQIEQLQADIASLAEQMSDMAEAKKDDLRVRAAKGAAAARVKIADGADAARDAAADLQEQAQVLGARAIEKARANPSATLGIAAGLGFLLGYMTRNGR